MIQAVCGLNSSEIHLDATLLHGSVVQCNILHKEVAAVLQAGTRRLASLLCKTCFARSEQGATMQQEALLYKLRVYTACSLSSAMHEPCTPQALQCSAKALHKP